MATTKEPEQKERKPSPTEMNMWKNGDKVVFSNLKNATGYSRLVELLLQSGAFGKEEEVVEAVKTGLVYVDGNSTIRVHGTGVCITGQIHPAVIEEMIHEINAPHAHREDPVTINPSDDAATIRNQENLDSIAEATRLQKDMPRRQKRARSASNDD